MWHTDIESQGSSAGLQSSFAVRQLSNICKIGFSEENINSVIRRSTVINILRHEKTNTVDLERNEDIFLLWETLILVNFKSPVHNFYSSLRDKYQTYKS